MNQDKIQYILIGILMAGMFAIGVGVYVMGQQIHLISESIQTIEQGMSQQAKAPVTVPTTQQGTTGQSWYEITPASNVSNLCTGDINLDEDSAAYRATLTKKIVYSSYQEGEKASVDQAVRFLQSVLGTDDAHGLRQQIARITIDTDGTLHYPFPDGSAGVSISNCSFWPTFEVNALQIPGVKKVVVEASAGN